MTKQQRYGDFESLSADEVVGYLRNHPDFFLKHPAVLESLTVPHVCGRAVSLVEYQVSVLRDQAGQQRHKLQDLIKNARGNEELNRRLHQLTLSLIECDCLDDVFAIVYQALSDEFGAEAAAIRLFVEPASRANASLGEFVDKDCEATRWFEPVFEAAKPLCGRLKPEQLEFLFSDRAHTIRSGALLPLGGRDRIGILAVGSFDEHRYHPGMGTVFLRHLSEILERVLSPYLAR